MEYRKLGCSAESEKFKDDWNKGALIPSLYATGKTRASTSGGEENQKTQKDEKGMIISSAARITPAGI